MEKQIRKFSGNLLNTFYGAGDRYTGNCKKKIMYNYPKITFFTYTYVWVLLYSEIKDNLKMYKKSCHFISKKSSNKICYMHQLNTKQILENMDLCQDVLNI